MFVISMIFFLSSIHYTLDAMQKKTTFSLLSKDNEIIELEKSLLCYSTVLKNCNEFGDDETPSISLERISSKTLAIIRSCLKTLEKNDNNQKKKSRPLLPFIQKKSLKQLYYLIYAAHYLDIEPLEVESRIAW
jgi:hypothetical protein